jgi:hypothetical protein
MSHVHETYINTSYCLSRFNMNTNNIELLKLVKNLIFLGKHSDGELLSAVSQVTSDPATVSAWSENVIKNIKRVGNPKATTTTK